MKKLLQFTIILIGILILLWQFGVYNRAIRINMHLLDSSGIRQYVYVSIKKCSLKDKEIRFTYSLNDKKEDVKQRCNLLEFLRFKNKNNTNALVISGEDGKVYEIILAPTSVASFNQTLIYVLMLLIPIFTLFWFGWFRRFILSLVKKRAV